MDARESEPRGSNGTTGHLCEGSGLARLKIILLSLVSLGVVSSIDWMTGYDGLFFVFYFVPVALCAWRLSHTVTLLMAALAGLSWLATDWLSGHQYSQAWLRYWDGFVCFLAFAILGLLMFRWQRSLDQERRARKELAEALEAVSRSNEEVRKLQSQLQVVCAWTKRINIDGKWMPLDEFLSSKLNVQISHGISPEASAELTKSLKDPAA
ncbi:MAG TPA: hypothetical protein VJA21_01385 [Verrucomicrobiae bacterium]